jgi:uncharacterized protein with PIN domain
VIVVDTSAIVAIVFNEPERSKFIAAIGETSKVWINTVAVVEIKMSFTAAAAQKPLSWSMSAEPPSVCNRATRSR